MKTEKMRLLGAHMSIAGGVAESIERGASIGCTAIQIFTVSNNRWISKAILPEEREKFHQNRDRVGIVLAHNNYLINLASPDPVISHKSFMSMLDELNRAEQLSLPFSVLHPGSHIGSGEEAGLKRITTHLNTLFSETRGSSVRVLVETTAGQGTNLGHRFEHIAEIISHSNYQERIGVCFDTCHSFAAGYDLRTQKGYEQTFEEFDRIIGISHLYAFHLNDSKNELGSRKDRHEHIGKGFLGLEAFRLLLNDERFIALPMVLETPKGDDMKEDLMNLAVLKGLIEAERAL
jgi:deoxyribonuclease-4